MWWSIVLAWIFTATIIGVAMGEHSYRIGKKKRKADLEYKKWKKERGME